LCLFDQFVFKKFSKKKRFFQIERPTFLEFVAGLDFPKSRR
jgi:hypothetical protein